MSRDRDIRMHNRPRRAAHGALRSWLLFATVALAACTGQSADSPDGGGESASAGATTSTDDPAETEVAVPPYGGDYPSPLESAWNRIQGTLGAVTDDETAAHEAVQMDQEELVAACMAQQGFEYIPWVPNWSGSRAVPFEARPEFVDLDPLGRARLFGHGFVMGAMEEQEHPIDPGVNPNDAIRDSLSAEGSREWRVALDACVEQHVTGALSEKIMAKFSDPIYQEFDEDASEVEIAIFLDPRVVTLDRSWSDCMAAAGHPGFDFDENTPGNHLSMRWEGLKAESEDGQTPDAGQAQELIAEEISIVVADETCQAQLDYVAARRAVQEEYESAFVAERAEDITYLTELFAASGR